MKSINFDTGIKRFAINNDENNTIEINIGDPNLLGRITRGIHKIENKVSSMQNIDLKADGTPYQEEQEQINAVEELDNYIRNEVDTMLGGPCAEQLFGPHSTLSMVGGVQLWERVLIAVVPMIKTEILSQQKQRMLKLNKYLKK